MQQFLKAFLLIMIVASVGGVGVWWWHVQSDPLVLFSTVPVKRGDVVTAISANGTLEPEEVVDVGAQVEGQISLFGKDESGKTIDYGSIVKQGSVLAKIDDSVYAADVAL